MTDEHQIFQELNPENEDQSWQVYMACGLSYRSCCIHGWRLIKQVGNTMIYDGSIEKKKLKLRGNQKHSRYPTGIFRQNPLTKYSLIVEKRYYIF